jgi:hypothetical protein
MNAVGVCSFLHLTAGCVIYACRRQFLALPEYHGQGALCHAGYLPMHIPALPSQSMMTVAAGGVPLHHR